MKKSLLILFFALLTTTSALAASRLSVMTFNIENGGTQVDFNKVVEAVRRSHANVVGLQEAWNNASRLAAALGWKYCDTSQSIISELPLYTSEKYKENVVFVEVKPNKFVAVANIHLPDEPYGPNWVKGGRSPAAVIQNEKTVRLPSALPTLRMLAALAKTGMPVFLTGDFNSPSYLDWTDSTVNVLSNHRYAVLWPVTHTAHQFGLVDSYRILHPNAVKQPAFTWPSGRPAARISYDGYNPSADDLPERIDFVLSGGPTTPIQSKLVGEAGSKDTVIMVSPWPSDHRAVVSQFKVTPLTVSRQWMRPVAPL